MLQKNKCSLAVNQEMSQDIKKNQPLININPGPVKSTLVGLPGIKESSPAPTDNKLLGPEPPEVGVDIATGKLKSRLSPITFKTDRVDATF